MLGPGTTFLPLLTMCRGGGGGMQVCVRVPGKGWGHLKGHHVQTQCEAPGPGWSAGLERSAMGATGMLGLGHLITARGSRPREELTGRWMVVRVLGEGGSWAQAQ